MTEWVTHCQWYDVETTINSVKLSQDWLKEIQFNLQKTESSLFLLEKEVS